MKILKIAKGISLPLDFVTQAAAILAKRRSGKSYTMRRIAEQLLEADQQIVLVDPKGDQWGIRSSADGKKPGYPITILGGEHGDVPLEVSAGELVAKLVVEERVSVLLDLSQFRKHEVATFMTAFMENLYRLKAREEYRTPVMLIIDEADAIAPQKPQKGEERMLGAAEDIVRRGGQRGIGCLLITQRSAVLNKNVLTQAQMLIVLRTIAPQDLAAMKSWVEVHGTLEEGKELMESLPSLPVGDAWFWSPGWPTNEGIFERAHVLPITTFDSGATPKPGEKQVVPKNVADVDLEALKTQMAETIEKARNADPKNLRKVIAELEKENESLKRRTPAEKPVQIKEIEVPVLKDSQIKKLEQIFDRMVNEAERHGSAMTLLWGNFDEIGKAVGTALQSLADAKKHPPVLVSSSIIKPSVLAPGKVVRIAAEPVHPVDRPEGISGPEQKVLNAIAWLGAVGVSQSTKDAIALVAGYKPTSGGFANICGKLRAAGLIDYPSPNIAALTATGAASAVAPDLSGGPEEIRQKILSVLAGPERKVLEPLIAAYPNEMSHEELAEASGYLPTSGGFANLKGRLRTFGLIIYPRPNFARAAVILFP